MSCKPALLALAALAAATPLSVPAPVWAEPSPGQPAPGLAPPRPGSIPTWSHPPEAVRAAVAALHDACAAWPKQTLPAAEPPSSPPAEADQPYVESCSLALDPGGFAQLSLLQGGALGAIAAGLAFVAFQAAKLLLSGLTAVIARGMDALWGRRRRRIHGLPE